MATKDLLTTLEGERLTLLRRELLDHSQQLLRRLRHSLFDDYDLERSRCLFEGLTDLGRVHQLTATLSGPNEHTSKVPVFVVSSEVLHDAFRRLAKISTEAILYAVGSRNDSTFTMERLIPIDLDVSQHGYARTDTNASLKTLVEIDKYGSILTGYFHMHPGKGANANHPSSIDLSNQERLERGQYHTVGGIFSRDGYLRFFTHKLGFRMSLIGKGVEHVGANLHRLTEID